jgi:adhesin/invasin
MINKNLAAIAGIVLAVVGTLAAANAQLVPGARPGAMSDSANQPDASIGTPTDPSAFRTSGTNGRSLLLLGEQTAQQTFESGTKSLLRFLGSEDSSYDWLRRTEINWGLLQRGKQEQSIVTVQPLYQSKGKEDTVFVQGSLLHYALFGDYRWTANLGAGYRRLLLDDTLLLGANTFFDQEFTYSHRRISIGGEVKWGSLDFGVNEYVALTNDRSVSGAIERAQSGRDFSLASQLPFIPWIKVSGNYFWWDRVRAANDIKSTSFAAEFALLPSLTVKYTRANYDLSNNVSRPQNQFLLSFTLAKWGDQPTLLTGPVISNQIFETRDLKDQTLTKVVRENRIIVERRTNVNGATVIISRLN